MLHNALAVWALIEPHVLKMRDAKESSLFASGPLRSIQREVVHGACGNRIREDKWWLRNTRWKSMPTMRMVDWSTSYFLGLRSSSWPPANIMLLPEDPRSTASAGPIELTPKCFGAGAKTPVLPHQVTRTTAHTESCPRNGGERQIRDQARSTSDRCRHRALARVLA